MHKTVKRGDAVPTYGGAASPYMPYVAGMQCEAFPKSAAWLIKAKTDMQHAEAAGDGKDGQGAHFKLKSKEPEFRVG